MYEHFGPVVDGDQVTFRLFFPDADRDASQYRRGGPPRIRSIRAVGDFQAATGGAVWDIASAPAMAPLDHPSGVVWTAAVPGLPEGFYQYKYMVTFENGEVRWCPDPCSRHVGGDHENAGFVIGGAVDVVRPVARRRPLEELVIYELMLDDFTSSYRGTRPPVDAVVDRIDHLVDLGVNAVEVMPWTAWRGAGFSWGYDPTLFFSVEDRYVSDPAVPADRLVRLKRLVNALHDRGIQVIMDGVFNHVRAGERADDGFGYSWLYQERGDSPYIGQFAAGGFFEDFDFGNACTLQFVVDVCAWWLDTFQLDGIRFDYTLGLFEPASPEQGIAAVIAEVREHLAGRESVALIIEHLSDDRYAAIDVANGVDATACWYDRFLHDMGDWAARDTIDSRAVRLLDATRSFGAGRGPVVYTQNHDHSSIVNRAGGRGRWWATQPTVIALATVPGAVMLHNGQEFGDDHYLPANDPGRVVPRPLDWDLVEDEPGQRLCQLYRLLLRLRREHPALAGPNIHPVAFDERRTRFDEQGYGVDSERRLMIYHRWGPGRDGEPERFTVVLNFSAWDQLVDVPVPSDGPWDDLISPGDAFDGHQYWARNVPVGSHWGRVLAPRR
jgi:pullulanase